MVRELMAEVEAEQAPAVVMQAQRDLLLILVVQLVTAIGFGFSMPFMPLFVQELGGFDARNAAFWSGVLGAGNGIVMAFAGPFWGIIADWFGYKRNVLRAAFGAFGILLVTAFTQNMVQLGILRTLMGAASGVTPATMGLLGSVIPRKRLPFAVGLCQGMASLGFTLGPLVGGILVVWLGFRLGFAFSGMLLGIAGLVVLFGIHPPQHIRPPGPRNLGQIGKEVRQLLAVPGMKKGLALVCAIQLAPNIAFPATVFFLKSLGTDVSPGTIGLYFTVIGLAATASAWGIGVLSTRFPLKALLFMACGVAATGAFGTSAADSVAVAIAWGAVLGTGVGMLTAGSAAWIGTLAPTGRSGAAFGIVQSANAIGFGLGPFAGGVIAQRLGLSAPFVAEGVLAMVVAMLVLQMDQGRKAASPA